MSARAKLPDVTDAEFREWEQKAFGYGYGTGEEHIVPVLKTFLESVPGENAETMNYDYQVLTTKLGTFQVWAMINVLCRTDDIEYGSSPRFGWLTRQGQRLRRYVCAKSADELVAVINSQDME